MRLSIESVNNRKKTLSAAGASKVLYINIKKQMASNWCWAAVASVLTEYFYGKKISQSTIVRNYFRLPRGNDIQENMTVDWLITHYNRQTLLSDVLGFLGCYSHWSPGKASYFRICSEIRKGYPVCIRIQWFSGDSHYVMITGVHPETGEICIEDSIHGASTQHFETFPGHYQIKGGVWRETYWTTCKKDNSFKNNLKF